MCPHFIGHGKHIIDDLTLGYVSILFVFETCGFIHTVQLTMSRTDNELTAEKTHNIAQYLLCAAAVLYVMLHMNPTNESLCACKRERAAERGKEIHQNDTERLVVESCAAQHKVEHKSLSSCPVLTHLF